jgi:hypothetical protein
MFSIFKEKSDLAGIGHNWKRIPAAKGSKNVHKCG